MSTKFKRGETVIYQNNARVVRVTQKNFSSGKIRYELEPKSKNPLDAGIKVDEDELKKAKKGTQPDTDDAGIIQLQVEYKKLYGKTVPNNKKNDSAWLISKIEEAEKEQNTGFQIMQLWDSLQELDHGQLIDLIAEKGIDIEVEDYTDKTELLKAMAEELDIEIE